MKTLVLALCLAAVTACGNDTNITPDPTGGSTSTNGTGGNGGAPNGQGLGYENGSRLKANVVHFGDGASQFVSWHDTELDIDCFNAKAKDGKQRCVPTLGVSIPEIYSDAGCTKRVALKPSCGASEGALAYASSATCDGVSTYRLGPSPSAVYAGTPANCVEQNSPEDFVTLTEEPLTSFAEGSVKTD